MREARTARAAQTAAGTADAQELTYEALVRPIFKTHCFHCHGEGGEMKAHLDLRLRRLVVKGGKSGPAVVPGNSQRSLLFQFGLVLLEMKLKIAMMLCFARLETPLRP